MAIDGIKVFNNQLPAPEEDEAQSCTQSSSPCGLALDAACVHTAIRRKSRAGAMTLYGTYTLIINFSLVVDRRGYSSVPTGTPSYSPLHA